MLFRSNASQITDGGAAVLLMRRDEAERLKVPILAKLVAVTTAGLPPRIMGIGPSFAIPKLLKMTSVSQDEIDLFEINEAFASMYVYCVKTLGLDIEKGAPVLNRSSRWQSTSTAAQLPSATRSAPQVHGKWRQVSQSCDGARVERSSRRCALRAGLPDLMQQVHRYWNGCSSAVDKRVLGVAGILGWRRSDSAQLSLPAVRDALIEVL